VKIVNVEDMTKVRYLREQTKGAKHVTFDPSGRYATVSCTDGLLYVYSLVSDDPELVRKLDGVIRGLEAEDEATARAVWHPDGMAFASAQATRDISVFSISDWSPQKPFSGGHNGDITALGWSPNGALLASAGADGQVLLWETKTQNILRRYDFANVINLAWHPTANLLSFTTSDGELFIYEGFVPREYRPLLEKVLESAPLLLGGPLVETSGNARLPMLNNLKQGTVNKKRLGTPDSLDDILGSLHSDDDGFIDDDDGAGYAEAVNGYGKRTNDHLDDLIGHDTKRPISFWSPRTHAPFQPGSTSWKGNRRYLCKGLSLDNFHQPPSTFTDSCRS
jgi:chromosome transmission fidelity protein 4